jgi:hypothetical protein
LRKEIPRDGAEAKQRSSRLEDEAGRNIKIRPIGNITAERSYQQPEIGV